MQERLAAAQEERGLRPLVPPPPPPIPIEFDGVTFMDSPEIHGLTPLTYVVTLHSIQENLRTFMSRHYSVEADLKTPETRLADAPTMLDNYLVVEASVRGLSALPLSIRLHLEKSVLSQWGFEYYPHQGVFRLPGQSAAPFAKPA